MKSRQATTDAVVLGKSSALFLKDPIVRASGLFHSNKSTLGTLIWAGIVAGIISALVKSGVESVLPPRPPAAIPPPIALLDLMGFDATNMTYVFNQTAVNWGGNGFHILFSVVIAIVYVWLVELYPKAGVWWGLPFGWITATLGAHCIVLPLLGVAPLPWDMGTAGFVSEIVGTGIWIWTIECVRRVMLHRSAG